MLDRSRQQDSSGLSGAKFCRNSCRQNLPLSGVRLQSSLQKSDISKTRVQGVREFRRWTDSISGVLLEQAHCQIHQVASNTAFFSSHSCVRCITGMKSHVVTFCIWTSGLRGRRAKYHLLPPLNRAVQPCSALACQTSAQPDATSLSHLNSLKNLSSHG